LAQEASDDPAQPGRQDDDGKLQQDCLQGGFNGQMIHESTSDYSLCFRTMIAGETVHGLIASADELAGQRAYFSDLRIFFLPIFVAGQICSIEGAGWREGFAQGYAIHAPSN
jgi:hypothetical protein